MCRSVMRKTAVGASISASHRKFDGLNGAIYISFWSSRVRFTDRFTTPSDCSPGCAAEPAPSAPKVPARRFATSNLGAKVKLSDVSLVEAKGAGPNTAVWAVALTENIAAVTAGRRNLQISLCSKQGSVRRGSTGLRLGWMHYTIKGPSAFYTAAF